MKEMELRRKIYEIKAKKINAMTNKEVVYNKQPFLPDLCMYLTVIILYSRMGLWLS
jgi:hypothetical protein